MIFNTYSEYAIKLVFNLVEKNDGQSFVRIRDIAKELDLSYYLLAKVANKLIKNKILTSTQGPNGGIRLSIHPSELTILDIIKHFSKLDDFSKCILGLNECNSSDPCAIHNEWLRTKEPLLEIFNKPITELDGIKSLKFGSFHK